MWTAAFDAKLKSSKIRVPGGRQLRYHVHFPECPTTGAGTDDSGEGSGGSTEAQTNGGDALVTLEVLAKESDMLAGV